MPTEIVIAVVPAVITSTLTLVGVWIQNSRHNKDVSELIAYRVKKLEEKQDKHNGMIERMYQVEQSVNILDERQKQDRKDIDELERTVKNGK